MTVDLSPQPLAYHIYTPKKNKLLYVLSRMTLVICSLQLNLTLYNAMQKKDYIAVVEQLLKKILKERIKIIYLNETDYSSETNSEYFSMWCNTKIYFN